MLKIIQTEQKDECLLAAGQNGQDLLDVINQEDVNEAMLKSHYNSYFSLFHTLDFEYIEEALSTGIRLDNELFDWMKSL